MPRQGEEPEPSRASGDALPTDAHEQELADLVSALTDRMQGGELLSLEDVCSQHPAHAQELRQIWGAIMVTDAVAAFARTDDSGQSEKKPADSLSIPSLPYRIGDYELQAVVGRGGMGVVYRARQISLNRTVAVKMIHENRPSSDENRARFFAEAEATARLEHPGIVPVFEVAQHEGHPLFSMQFVQGETLAELLQRGPLPQRKAARYVASVARAIDYAHGQGILHRDIKPSNIMVDERDEVRVTDFGLAKFSDSSDRLTRTGAVIGTPSYMSPEQATGRTGQLGPQSDVYSLGTVLYHLLVGRPPFIADSPVELALQILEHDPPPPRLLEPRLDADLDMIVQRAIQKPIDLRYVTAGELADDLDCFLRDEPVAARSGKLAQVAARWFRETHHAAVLENWGLLWMWHSLVLLIVCLATEYLHWSGVTSRFGYASLWIVGLGTWAGVFWALRRWMGPVTFVERQIAHVWGASLAAIAALTPLEWLLDLEPLKLSPILGLVGAMVFFVKAGILTGSFYLQSAALLVTSFFMALLPNVAHTMFGCVSAACFFIPGLKYYRRRQRNESSDL